MTPESEVLIYFKQFHFWVSFPVGHLIQMTQADGRYWLLIGEMDKFSLYDSDSKANESKVNFVITQAAKDSELTIFN